MHFSKSKSGAMAVRNQYGRISRPGEERLGPALAGSGLLLTFTIFTVSLTGISTPLTYATFNIQLLEILQLGPLLWTLFLLPRIYRSELVFGTVTLLAVNAVPLIYGFFVYGASSAMRDFAGIYYMLILVFGYALGRYAVISASQLLVGLSAVGLVFVTAYTFRISENLIDYEVIEYNFRIPAMVCSCAAALVLAGFGRLTGWRRLAILAGGLMYAAFVLQLRTRGAYLGLATGFIVVLVHVCIRFFNDPGYLAKVLGRLIVALVAVVLASVLYTEWLSVLFSNARERSDVLFAGIYFSDPTVAFRLDAWRLAWEEFLDSPIFGVGFGKYMILDPWLRREFALYPSHMMHNGVLQILYSGGILAMGGMVFFWWRVRRILRDSTVVTSVIPVLALTLSLLVYTSFGAILFKSVEAVPLWLIVGLAIGDTERHVLQTKVKAMELRASIVKEPILAKS
jgi:O-antigen ligase